MPVLCQEDLESLKERTLKTKDIIFFIYRSYYCSGSEDCHLQLGINSTFCVFSNHIDNGTEVYDCSLLLLLCHGSESLKTFMDMGSSS